MPQCSERGHARGSETKHTVRPGARDRVFSSAAILR
jgi:hypothetical protein